MGREGRENDSFALLSLLRPPSSPTRPLRISAAGGRAVELDALNGREITVAVEPDALAALLAWA